MLRFKIAGMSCGHCVQTITAAVKAVDPGAKVDIDLARKDVEVRTTVASERIAEAIREAGYEPSAAGFSQAT